MAKSIGTCALIVHGGAGAIGPANERANRKRGMLEAVRRGAAILRRGGSALDAVTASVTALEDDPLFNAGYGSLLNSEGAVEMDASVMVARPQADGRIGLHAGAVAAITRVKNPVLLARAVMEKTGHLLMAGPAAERFARKAGIPLCRAEDLISERARERWRARMQRENRANLVAERAQAHGTVGAVALDVHGQLAAATSTGGVPGKMAGRVGDSALIGAGVYADAVGAASATGHGEAIIMSALCREAVRLLGRSTPTRAAQLAITRLIAPQGAEAGIVLIDTGGRIGYAHNADSMEVGTFHSAKGISHRRAAPNAAKPRG
jgi:beta-aspartyl-peptidase (threonine type)